MVKNNKCDLYDVLILFYNFRLTAYVSLAFNQARSYIYIDDSIVISALKWLSANQATNGSFVETGNVVHEELQNKDKKSLALTAYVLLTFQQNQVKLLVFLVKRYFISNAFS